MRRRAKIDTMGEDDDRVARSDEGRPPSRPFVVHESDCDVEDWSASGRNGVSWSTLISADRTPTDSLTMGIAEIEPGSPDEFHLHRHEPAEAYYILSGSGAVSIDGEEHDVRAGSAIFVPSDSVHAIANTGTDVLRLLYVFGVGSFDDVTYLFAD
jgi:mannose-6-phosphate isomerase-like protein (cupin superfamily)